MSIEDPATSTITDLAKRVERSLFGKYRAKVVDNQDPDRRGRLKLAIPSVFGVQATDWVPGAFPLASAAEALFVIPETGSHVLAEFVEGDRSQPIWTACYLPNATPPTDDYDVAQDGLHLLRTRGGIVVRLEDDGADAQVVVIRHPGGGELRIDAEGIISVTDEGGASVTLDPVGNVTELKGHGSNGGVLRMNGDQTMLGHGSVSLTLDPSGVTIDAPMVKLDGDQVFLGRGAGSPILDGMKFAGFYDAHTHIPPIGGIPPPLSAALMGMRLQKVFGA